MVAFFCSRCFLRSNVTAADLRELPSTNRTLNEQRLDIDSSSADSGVFLLSSTLVVLRRKPSPGAKMLRGGEHGHIHSNFRNNANCGKGLDTRSRHNKIQLRKILFGSIQDQGFQIGFAEFKSSHVGTDDAELFSWCENRKHL